MSSLPVLAHELWGSWRFTSVTFASQHSEDGCTDARNSSTKSPVQHAAVQLELLRQRFTELTSYFSHFIPLAVTG